MLHYTKRLVCVLSLATVAVFSSAILLVYDRFGAVQEEGTSSVRITETWSTLFKQNFQNKFRICSIWLLHVYPSKTHTFRVLTNCPNLVQRHTTRYNCVILWFSNNLVLIIYLCNIICKFVFPGHSRNEKEGSSFQGVVQFSLGGSAECSPLAQGKLECLSRGSFSIDDFKCMFH